METAQGQQYQGDFLVLAAGSQVNFFDTPGADKYSYPLYSLHDAELLRSRILAMLESADRDPSLLAKGALNFVIVGAGPTGTEMAGAFGDMLQSSLKSRDRDKAYKKLGVDRAQIFWWMQAMRCLAPFLPRLRHMPPKCLKNEGCNFAWIQK